MEKPVLRNKPDFGVKINYDLLLIFIIRINLRDIIFSFNTCVCIIYIIFLINYLKCLCFFSYFSIQYFLLCCFSGKGKNNLSHIIKF